MDIESFLRARAGVTKASALRGAGFTHTARDKALAAGRIVRIRRGIYSLPREAGLFGVALNHNALLTCLSAAPTYGLWTLQEPGAVHLSPPHRVTPPGTLAHGRCIHPRHPWLPVAGLADVLIHALRCPPEVVVGQHFEDGVRPRSHVIQDCPCARIAVSGQLVAQELHGDVSPLGCALDHNERFHLRQAAQGVNEHVGQAGHRQPRMRWMGASAVRQRSRRRHLVRGAQVHGARLT
jgi:hypothetical protein